MWQNINNWEIFVLVLELSYKSEIISKKRKIKKKVEYMYIRNG